MLWIAVIFSIEFNTLVHLVKVGLPIADFLVSIFLIIIRLIVLLCFLSRLLDFFVITRLTIFINKSVDLFNSFSITI
jgi:hypothetical protein